MAFSKSLEPIELVKPNLRTYLEYLGRRLMISAGERGSLIKFLKFIGSER